MSDGGFLEDVEDDDDDQEVGGVVVEEQSDEQEMVTVESKEVSNDGPLQLAGDLEELAETYQEYENVKSELLTDQDTATISGKPTIKRSGWRKIATAFNVSVDIIDRERTVENGVITHRVTVRARAPNGKTLEGVGTAASNESNHMDTLSNRKDKDKDDDDVLFVDGKFRVLKDPRAVNEHNILATAETRAKNRAISDLVGGGEVSAEEMDATDLMG